MGEHARFSPSDAVRWLNCPAAIHFDDVARAEGTIVDGDTLDIGDMLKMWEAGELAVASLPASARGTIAHAYAEGEIAQRIQLPRNNAPVVPPDLIDATLLRDNADTYVARIVELVEQGFRSGVELEKKVPLWYEKGSYGTVDFTAVSVEQRRLVLVDYKSGYGIVDPFRNPQLGIYAIGILDQVSLFHEIEHVQLGICQPAVDGHIQWDTSVETPADLESLREVTVRRVTEVDAPWCAPIPVVTDAGCNWCRHKARCPAQHARAARAIEAPDVTLLTPAELAAVQRQKKAVEGFLDAVEQWIRDHIVDFPGWVEGPPRTVRQDWTDTAAAAAFLRTHGVEPFREPALISYSEAKRLLPPEDRKALEKMVEAVKAAHGPLIEEK